MNWDSVDIAEHKYQEQLEEAEALEKITNSGAIVAADKFEDDLE